jgi:hypothetical protein
VKIQYTTKISRRRIPPDGFGLSLFYTIGAIVIDSQYSHLLNASVRDDMRKAMYMAVVGDGYRVGGLEGDNLYPGYSNVSDLSSA